MKKHAQNKGIENLLGDDHQRGFVESNPLCC